MKEQIFNTELVNSFKYYGSPAYKIPDMPRSFTSKFLPPKPFDIFKATHGGGLTVIESKQIKKWEKFSLKNLRPNQIEALDEIARTKNEAYVFLNVRIKKPYVNTCFIFNWKEQRELLEKGISGKDLQKNWAGFQEISYKRIEGKVIWDVSGY